MRIHPLLAVIVGIALPLTSASPRQPQAQQASGSSLLSHKLQRHSVRFGLGHPFQIGSSALADGSRLVLRVPLEAGREYSILAVCDDACTDLDLALITGDFPPVEDIEPDAYPLLRYTPRRTDVYQVEVTMEACSARRCSFKVNGYRR